MEKYVDRNAGFAAFRTGRSLCVRLQGTLDGPMARGVARQIPTGTRVIRLRLECSSLHTVEPMAGRILAGALRRWEQRRDERSVEILNLDLPLLRSAACEPLRPFADKVWPRISHPEHNPYWQEEPLTSRWSS